MSDPRSGAPPLIERLPTEDPELDARDLDLDRLERHWRRSAALPPISAEQMRGADARAQRMGVPGHRLMEEAGTAVAAVARALLSTAERSPGTVLVLCGPGNNGGDGSVAARRLAAHGLRSVVVLVASEERPGSSDAARNWDRLAEVSTAERIHAPTTRDLRILLAGAGKASLVIDALLGTGVVGTLREPVRSAVEGILRLRGDGVPVLAVDTPTALDLTSGRPSDPVVHAHATVTFHRPKTGLGTRIGRALAGRILVAPIGIPAQADPR